MSEFFSHPVPAVVVLLGLLVFVHEFGHFIVGRLCGIAVETFSIGFGPRILNIKHRGTDYRVSWIPLGGYVKFAGAHPTEEVPAGLPGRSFLKTPLPLRAATVLAGPFANFLLAVAVYTVLGSTGISHPPPTIGEVIVGSAAERAGIQYGDRLVEMDGRKIVTWRDLEEVISKSPGKELTITVKRTDGLKALKLTPAALETTDILGKPVTIGRAGIALGRQPPVVTVTGADSAAAQAGLVTGDRIERLTYSDRVVDIKAIPELRSALFDAAKQTERVTLTVAKAAVPDPKAKIEDEGHAVEASPTRAVTLDLAAVRASDPDQVLAILGLADAQLTVGAATDSAAGVLERGDYLRAWNGQPLRDFYALSEFLLANTQPEATVTVIRDFKSVDFKVSLSPVEIQRPDGVATFYRFPVVFWAQPEDPEPVVERYDGLLSALGYGITETGRQTAELGSTVARLFTGDIPIKALGGPMLIAKVAGDSARHGWQTFLGSLALISINLGLINLFPIPVLDGGQLVLMGAEAVRRRPLREAAIENFQKVGFAMIVALVMLATYNDLSRFWKSMLSSLVGLFQ